MTNVKYLLLTICLVFLHSSIIAKETRPQFSPYWVNDNWDQNYPEFLTQLQIYAQENPACSCYFPVEFSGSWDVRVFCLRALEDLVWTKFSLNSPHYYPFYNLSEQENRIEWNRFEEEFSHTEWYVYRFPQHFMRLYFAIFKNAFFYSQYRTVLLDLALHSEGITPYLGYRNPVVDGYNATYSYLGDLQDCFFKSYTQCLLEHPHPKIYYERGMIHAHRGDWDKSIEDIRSAVDLAGSTVDNVFSSALYLHEGSYYAEQGLYDQAVLALTDAIAKNPNNKDAYFERANAYFEKMEFDLALKDFIASGVSTSAKDDNKTTFSIDYAQGLITGMQKGLKQELGEARACWIPVLNMGLWVLMNSSVASLSVPPASFVTATLGCVAAVGATLAIDKAVTELKELVTNWKKLSEKEKGELTGFLISKYGIDIFAAYGSSKCMDAYQRLRKANNALTFEFMLAEKTNQELVAKKVAEQVSKRPKGKNIQAFNEGRVLKDKEKMKHIFAEKHKLGKLGEPKEALEKITDAVFHADVQGKIPQNGAFDILVKVDGYPVSVRGAIVQGELRYGTIFIQE